MKTRVLIIAGTLLLAAGFSIGAAFALPTKGGTAMGEPATWRGMKVLPAGAQPVVPVKHSEAEWKALLGDVKFKILRQQATEAACSGAYWDEHRAGTYYSAATGQPLFVSDQKFDSGTGWPSFFRPITPDAIILRWDHDFGMDRIEVLDSSSGSHLGHVFDDAPAANGGLRFCMNSESLIFVPQGAQEPNLVREWRANRSK